MSREISIQYYAALREARGIPQEVLLTNAETPWQLYEQLQKLYDLNLPTNALAVAINHAFSSWDTPLQSNDTVVFLPPFSRGQA
jgi:molybdopterin converting factor small subunit